MAHIDPLCLKTDVCHGCHVACTNERVPCLTCFGNVHYCSESCLWKHYPEHNIACSKQFSKIRRSQFFQHRHWQYGPRRGYSELLQHVLKNVTLDVLQTNLFFIRLPYDTDVKMKSDYPIKQVARVGAITQLKVNECFKLAWQTFIHHEQHTPSCAHFFAYPPDTSFVFWTALPLNGDTTPTMRLIPCPCSIHAPK